MDIIKTLIHAILFGDKLSLDQYTHLKDIYNTYIFGRALRSMIKTGDSVLELGCGKDSLLVRSGLIKKINVIGVDIFRPYVDKHKAGGLYKDCILADITKVEFPDNQFDAVVCMDVLEHIPKDKGYELLAKMKRWGRHVIITTPNGYVNGIKSDDNIYQNHLSGWMAKELRACGYKVRGASGWKPLRKPDSQLIHLHPLVFWASLSLISSFVVFFIPQIAFHLEATFERK